MRNTLLLLLLNVFQILGNNNNTYSQSTTLTMNLMDVSVKEVLLEIEAQSDFFFLYNSKLIDVDKKVDLSVKKQKINNILAELFNNTDVEHVVFNRQIILTLSDYDGIKKEFQQNSISGTVTEESGQPLPGVTVVVKGTTQGTVTNAEGEYSLSNIPEDATLQFSFVGMLTQEIEVGTQTTINVTMAEDAVGIDEVVVVGYGTQIKHKITSSVSSIKVEEALEGRPIVSVQQGLSGMTPGLNVAQTNGRPGSFPGLTIRGSGNPMVLVDGFESSLGDVDPNQIKDISVLKDASAAAIYGLRAADGVILITTKSGQKNKPAEFTYPTLQVLTLKIIKFC